MKSRIRSRWHRANEKPLEKDGAPAPTSPIGEINPASLSVLTDDLSNAKPPQNLDDHSKNHAPRHDQRNNRGKPGNRRSQPRNNKLSHHSNSENAPVKQDESKNSAHHSKSKPRRRRQNQGKQSSENSKQSRKQPNQANRQSNKPAAKATGLKGFLGKLFG